VNLKGLTVLEDLARLKLSAADTCLPAVVWSSLAALTGITFLKVECEPTSGQRLLCLTSCQHLEELCIQRCYSGAPGSHVFAPGFDDKVGLHLQVGMCYVLTKRYCLCSGLEKREEVSC